MGRPNRGSWDERDEDLENQLNRSAMWAVTYGDLMSYLMIFFLMLYVAASTRGVGMQMSIKAAEQRFANDAQTIEQLFTRYGAQKIARLEVGENKIRIVFLAPVLFESGSAFLKPQSLPILQQVVKSINDMPNSIQVEGHTDDRPLLPGSKFDSNWELSSSRAFAVLRFLEINGIPEQRLSATGYGEFRPQQSWSMTYSITCSKPRAGEFGGGAVFVTADEIHLQSAYEFVSERQQAFQQQQEAVKLIERASQLGIQPEDLDGLVHDTASNPASAINNGGLAAQIEWLVGRLGPSAVEDHLTAMARGKRGDRLQSQTDRDAPLSSQVG